MQYKLCQGSVLFHGQLDALNDYQTLVFSQKDGSLHKVNKIGYQILKHLNEAFPWQMENKAKRFIEEMIKIGVVVPINT